MPVKPPAKSEPEPPVVEEALAEAVAEPAPAAEEAAPAEPSLTDLPRVKFCLSRDHLIDAYVIGGSVEGDQVDLQLPDGRKFLRANRTLQPPNMLHALAPATWRPLLEGE